MKLKYLIASTALAFATFASVSASAEVLSATLETADNVNYSANFGNTITSATPPIGFTDTIHFLPANLGGSADGFIGTIAFRGVHNIDLISVILNGIGFGLLPLGPGEVGFLAPVNVNAPLILTVVGNLTGTTGSYAGALNLVARVPEPGILALLGIAGLGLALSRRRKEPTLPNDQLATA